MEFPPAGAVLIPLAAAVGYSRVHVGVHHRSDVWAGAAVGVTLAVIGRSLWPVKPWGPALMAAGTAPSLPEGKGLTVIVNQASGTSDLVMLDAETLEDVAAVHLPARVPAGFHGSWSPTT
jgi:undecaprenyl-diphosphatase